MKKPDVVVAGFVAIALVLCFLLVSKWIARSKTEHPTQQSFVEKRAVAPDAGWIASQVERLCWDPTRHQHEPDGGCRGPGCAESPERTFCQEFSPTWKRP